MSSPKNGPHEESHEIASLFFSALSANLPAGKLCGFFSIKRKLFRLRLALYFEFEGEFHFTGILMLPAIAIPHCRNIAFDNETDPDSRDFPEDPTHGQ
jgi:hypothetical protein